MATRQTGRQTLGADGEEGLGRMVEEETIPSRFLRREDASDSTSFAFTTDDRDATFNPSARSVNFTGAGDSRRGRNEADGEEREG